MEKWDHHPSSWHECFLDSNTSNRLTIMTTQTYLRRFALSIAMLLTTTVLHAQAELDININKNGGGSAWYGNPIIWIVAAAVFILLLVALLRGSKK
jgi:hypothetical protein